MANIGSQRTASGLDGAVLADRYEVARVVTRGANTVIVDAIDRSARRPVTLKIVRPEHARSADFRFKFDRLAEISKALTHPNIASVQDWGEVDLEDEPTVFWTVDALGGGSMRDLLDRGRLLAPGQALVVGLEACRALDAAHRRGLFHTELTPSKMVFGADRRLRVIDFGMARLLGESTWEDVSGVPTHVARYASPEQALGLPIDARTDVYALSLVLIESVTGIVPFDGDSTQATLAGRIDRLMPVSADLGSLAAVLERAGRPEAADRFSAAEFGRALVQAAGKLPKPEPIPILATGSFDTTSMRRPGDPTGGVERPRDVPPVSPPDVGDGAGDEVTAAGTAAASALAETRGAADDHDSAEPDPDASAEPDPVTVDAAPGAADDDSAADDLAPTQPVDAVGGAGSVSPVDADLAPTQPVDAVAGAGSVSSVDADLPPTQPVDAVGGAGSVSSVDADLPPTQPVDAVAGTVSVSSADDVSAPSDAATTSPDVDDTTVGHDEHDTAVDIRIVDEPARRPATEEMPASLVAAARTATTPTSTLGITEEAAPARPSVFDDPDLTEPRDGTGEIYDDRPRRRRGPIVLLVLLLLAGLGALGYAGSLLLQTKSYEVPQLAGTAEGPARNQIGGNDWDVRVARERSDSFPEPDTVIRTEPGPGTDLDEGESITLVLSDGFEFRPLPDVAGLTAEAARAQLEDLMLQVVEAPEREYSEDDPAGTVISWQVVGDSSLQEGAQVLPDETISLTVSQGPEPRDVPDLSGQTLDEATATLDELALGIDVGDEVFSDDVPTGRVVDHTPGFGEQLERGGSVTVQVSKGPDIIVLPDLEGRSFAEARELLVDTGFEIGDVLGTTDGTFVQLTVDGDEAPVGSEFRRGQIVDLVFL